MKQRCFFSIILCVVCISIWGQTMDSKVKLIDFSMLDSCIVKGMGKTNADIILYADSIVARTVAWEGCKEESIRLSESMSAIVKYTFCTPAMYISNKKVYASFQTYLTLTFHQGDNCLSIQFDYDINKWMIKNDNNVIICHDLKNSALLQLFYILFQNNPLIERSYKNILQ